MTPARRVLIALMVVCSASIVSACGSNVPEVPKDIVWEQVSVGYDHICAVDTQGHVYCWGNNEHGELGIGRADSVHRTPVIVHSDKHFTQVTAGWNHTCAVRQEGEIYCWGRSRFGAMGNGQVNAQDSIQATPTKVESEQTFRQVAAGAGFNCALAQTDSIYCWGFNKRDQLGLGVTDSIQPGPAVVEGSPSSVTDLTAGTGHVCVLTEGGDGFCWGSNEGLQIGTGSRAGMLTSPQKVVTPGSWQALDTGLGTLTCGVLQTGALACWGGGGRRNTASIYRDGDPVEPADSPQGVFEAPDFQALAVGYDFVCGLGYEDNLYCDGILSGNYLPVSTPPMKQIDAGHGIGCGVTTDGDDVFCWGGQERWLGRGPNQDQGSQTAAPITRPIQVQ